MDSRTPFGIWLRQRRKLFDLTQRQLADQVGCSSVTIRKLEAGERKPSRQMATILATVLNIPDGEHDAFVRFARSDDGNVSFAIPAWNAIETAWRDHQLPPNRPLDVPLRSAMTLAYDVVAEKRPQRAAAPDGRTLFWTTGEGKIRGSLKGRILLQYTQIVWPKPSEMGFPQALPMRVAVSFRVQQGDAQLEGYCTGVVYPALDAKGNGTARFQASGHVISVSLDWIDYFLGRVFLEEDVKMVEGTGTGARGVMRVEAGVG